MASTDARPVPQKNVAYRVTFPILDADGDLVTGAAGLDSEVSKDGGTFADCTNEATEIATASGMYFLDLTSTEMNADTVAIIVKTSTSGAKTVPIVLYPEEAGDIRVNVTQVNGTAQSAGDLSAKIDAVDDFLDTEVAAILAAVDTEVAAIKAKTDNLPATPAAVGSAMTLTSGERDSVADALLDRNMATGADSGSPTVRTVRQALRFLRNKWDIAAGTLTVRKEDDSTASWTAAVTATPGADPVTGSDPA